MPAFFSLVNDIATFFDEASEIDAVLFYLFGGEGKKKLEILSWQWLLKTQLLAVE
jgi:hypothetical protein